MKIFEMGVDRDFGRGPYRGEKMEETEGKKKGQRNITRLLKKLDHTQSDHERSMF